MCTIRTWAHMINTACPILRAHFVRRGKTKVCDGNSLAIFKAEDVLRLEISMKDSKRMAVLDAIQQLHEDMTNSAVPSQILLTAEDLCKEIMGRGVIEDDVGVLALFDDFVEGNDIEMGTGQLMEHDLSVVSQTLPRAWTMVPVVKTFDGVGVRMRL